MDLPEICGTYTHNFPLADFTTLKVGGNAEVFAEFTDLADLQTFLEHKPEDLPFTILGEGSNVMILDGGIEGVVARIHNLMNGVQIAGTLLQVGAGATCGKAGRAAREADLSGLEFYAGIPGSIGGALRMNAGCYGQETADRLRSVQVLSPRGKLRNMKCEELNYTYRHCGLPADWIFVSATFDLVPGDKAKVKEKMRKINAERRESQPLEKPSSGSWFKNPVVNGEKLSAWKVTDAAGCRGLQVGQAQVSEKHSNFFVNLGGAKAADFIELSRQVEARILETQGIVMEREVRFLGKLY